MLQENHTQGELARDCVSEAIIERLSKNQSCQDSYYEAFEFLSKASFCRPNRIKLSAWVGHFPFAFWIIQVANPACLVELETYSGTSYAVFCQAVQTPGLKTNCYAIPWEGDEQTGFCAEEIFAGTLVPQHQDQSFVEIDFAFAHYT
jgi:hypothetical protein